MEIKNGEVKLNEEQTMIFAAMLKGALLGHNEIVRSGEYVEKNTRDLMGKVAEMVRQFEDNDIL